MAVVRRSGIEIQVGKSIRIVRRDEGAVGARRQDVMGWRQCGAQRHADVSATGCERGSVRKIEILQVGEIGTNGLFQIGGGELQGRPGDRIIVSNADHAAGIGIAIDDGGTGHLDGSSRINDPVDEG